VLLTSKKLTDQVQQLCLMANPLRLAGFIGQMSGGTMINKTFTLARRLLMFLSAILSLFLVLFPETGMKGITDV